MNAVDSSKKCVKVGNWYTTDTLQIHPTDTLDIKKTTVFSVFNYVTIVGHA